MTVIKKNQTLLDFVTQFGGRVDDLFTVAIANGVSITEAVAPGTELIIEAVELRVTKYFNNSVFDITTLGDASRKGGINFMQISTNFIVS